MTRYLIAGAGSLGTVYGAMLVRAGHDVQLLARASHAAAVTAAGGVELRSFGHVDNPRLRATDDPAALDPVDAVVLACKAPDTDEVLASTAHLADGVRAAMSLQNGVTAADALAAWCGPAAAVGAVSMVGGTLEAPGVVAHTFAGPTFLGPLADTDPAAVEVLAGDIGAAGLEVVVTDRIRSVEWSKLVHASPSMAITALTRLPFHLAFTTPELAEVFLDLVVEGATIARAAGVDVDDWPHILPVRSLAEAPREEGLATIRARGAQMVEGGMTEVRISMLQSVERRRPTEVDAIHGHLAAEAARLGVPAPTTVAVQRLLKGLDRVIRSEQLIRSEQEASQ